MHPNNPNVKEEELVEFGNAISFKYISHATKSCLQRFLFTLSAVTAAFHNLLLIIIESSYA